MPESAPGERSSVSAVRSGSVGGVVGACVGCRVGVRLVGVCVGGGGCVGGGCVGDNVGFTVKLSRVAKKGCFDIGLSWFESERFRYLS